MYQHLKPSGKGMLKFERLLKQTNGAIMGTPAPLLHVHGEDEFRLFGKMLRRHSSLDFDGL